MVLVKIADVSLFDLGSKQLWGCNIDRPEPGSQTEVYAINILGWVLGRNSPAVAVEVMDGDVILRRVPLRVRRPDIAAAYPDVLDAEISGFQTTLGLLEMTLEFELLVRAVLRDGSRVPIATIRGQRCSLHSDFQPEIYPLMVTSLGRTGTTWLMRLLTEHPQIIVYEQYPYEVHTVRYWMHMLRVLSGPANHFQSADFDNFDASMYRIGHNPFYSEPMTDNPQLNYWFGRTYVEQLAAFCQHSIEGFYQQVVNNKHQLEAVYFAEKQVPDRIPELIWELYPQAREIILVRDFRDMLCSMVAYNSKRRHAAFGRELVPSDEEFITLTRLYAQSLLQAYESRSRYAHLLRYEDLILRPVEALSALLEYLDLDSTPSTVEGLIQRAWEGTPDMKQHRTSLDPERSIGRWRRDLDASSQIVYREAFSDILEEFGYTE